MLRQEPKYLGGGKYSIRKKLKKYKDPEPLVNFAEIEGSDRRSVDQDMFDESSTKLTGANEPRKMLASLQPSPSRDKRNIQSANLHTKKSRLIERNRRLRTSQNSNGVQDFRQYQLEAQHQSTVNTYANDNLSSKRTASQFTRDLKHHKRGLSGTIRGNKPKRNPMMSTTETGRSLNRSSMAGDALTSAAADPSQEGLASATIARGDPGSGRRDKVQQMLELQRSDPEGFQLALTELLHQADSV